MYPSWILDTWCAVLMIKVSFAKTWRYGCYHIQIQAPKTAAHYTANVNSQITDKLRHLSELFLNKHIYFWIFLKAAIITDKFLLKSKSNLISSKKTEKILSVWKKFVKTTTKICIFHGGCLFFNKFSVWFKI